MKMSEKGLRHLLLTPYPLEIWSVLESEAPQLLFCFGVLRQGFCVALAVLELTL